MDRLSTHELKEMGGIAALAPKFAIVFLIVFEAWAAETVGTVLTYVMKLHKSS